MYDINKAHINGIYIPNKLNNSKIDIFEYSSMKLEVLIILYVKVSIANSRSNTHILTIIFS